MGIGDLFEELSDKFKKQHKNIFPDKLPISREEDYHTHYLGRVNDGRLFWGYVTFAFTQPYGDFDINEWQKYRNEYAVLHTFDKQGRYIDTKHWSINNVEDKGQTYTKLQEFVAELGPVEYEDIEIELFQTTIDSITFGLIPDIETESIELQPSSTIAFQAPWDGQYDT
jgi:hypothetical protein